MAIFGKKKKSIAETIRESEDLSWQQLQELEQRRRAVLQKNTLPFYRILLSTDGTVWQTLWKDPLLYTALGIYFLARLYTYVGDMPEYVSHIGGADVAIVGAFLSFFLVYFVNNNMTRFYYYGCCMIAEARIFDIAALARCLLPTENAFRLIRYVNALHASAYVGLSDVYTFENFFLELNKLNRFLTEKEMDRMKAINMDTAGGSTHRELTMWCIAEVQQAEKDDIINSDMAVQMRAQILRLRGTLGELFDYSDQPVSFFYLHFICVLMAL